MFVMCSTEMKNEYFFSKKITEKRLSPNELKISIYYIHRRGIAIKKMNSASLSVRNKR